MEILIVIFVILLVLVAIVTLWARAAKREREEIRARNERRIARRETYIQRELEDEQAFLDSLVEKAPFHSKDDRK